MADLNLTGQSVKANQIGVRLLDLKGAMDARKVIWDKLPLEKRKQWVQNAATVDPIMDIAWDIFKYLKRNFYDGTHGEG
jgi:hypothetical protein